MEANCDGFVAVHIGAGRHSRLLKDKYRCVVARACQEGVRLLRLRQSAMDVVEACTVMLEDSPLTNAGRGSNLSIDGKIELDASVMCGESLRWAAVGAVPGVKNPVRVARKLADNLDTAQLLGRTPPCMLVGIEARRYARQNGIQIISSKRLETEKSVKSYLKHKVRLDSAQASLNNRLDTVGVVVVDGTGNVAAGCSSGGIALKTPGRVGQAAVYGCGVWAENEENARPGVAISTTGCGEHLIRTHLAQTIARHVPGSDCSPEQLHNTLHHHFLQSKFLKNVSKPMGGVLYLDHKSSPDGGSGEVLWAHTTSTMCVGYMNCSETVPHAFVSRLPANVTPGEGVLVNGTSFRTGIKPNR